MYYNGKEKYVSFQDTAPNTVVGNDIDYYFGIREVEGSWLGGWGPSGGNIGSVWVPGVPPEWSVLTDHEAGNTIQRGKQLYGDICGLPLCASEEKWLYFNSEFAWKDAVWYESIPDPDPEADPGDEIIVERDNYELYTRGRNCFGQELESGVDECSSKGFLPTDVGLNP